MLVLRLLPPSVMMPEQNSNSVSRGRTQATKPLTATSASLTAPTASTRAKSKPQVSATSTSAEKRSAVLKTSASCSSITAPKTRGVPRQGVAEIKLEAIEAPLKLKSQPLKATLNKEAPTKYEANAIPVDSENITPLKESEATDDKPVEPSVVLRASNDTPHPSEPTDTESSNLLKSAEPSQTLPPTADSLQVAAQRYPWLYMSSTLDACFAEAEKTASKELGDLEKKVTEEEAELADEKLRFESERLIKFYDELGSDIFAKEAPTIMQSFISFGEVCERVEAEALQLAVNTPSLESEEPLQAYQMMIDNLDELQEQASKLESSILRLTKSSTALPAIASGNHQGSSTTGFDTEKDSDNDVQVEETREKNMEDADSAKAQIMGVFTACLPVLRARMANLSMAQELIESAQENFSLALRMESMGIE